MQVGGLLAAQPPCLSYRSPPSTEIAACWPELASWSSLQEALQQFPRSSHGHRRGLKSPAISDENRLKPVLSQTHFSGSPFEIARDLRPGRSFRCPPRLWGNFCRKAPPFAYKLPTLVVGEFLFAWQSTQPYICPEGAGEKGWAPQPGFALPRLSVRPASRQS